MFSITIKKSTFKLRWILFVCLILSYCMTTSDVEQNTPTLIKYVVLLICLLYSGTEYFLKRNSKILISEYRGLYLFILIIVLYTSLRSIIAFRFSFRTIQELIFLLAPIIYGYFVINTWNQKDIDHAMAISLLLAFLCYLLSLGLNFNEIIMAFNTSNFSMSYSELESSTYCSLAIAYCFYFCYYNANKIYMITSILFVVMTFKRFFIVMAILLFIFSHFQIKDKTVSRKIINIATTFLMIFAIIYFVALQPENVKLLENKFNLDVTQFTMTRNDRLRWLITSSYKTYGFGSSTEYMYKYFYGALEMDACKIIIELGYLPLAIMFISYLQFARTTLYTFTFMVLMMINLIVSSGLTGTFAWCLVFISASKISIYKKDLQRGIIQ